MSASSQKYHWVNFAKIIHNAYTAWVILLLSLMVTLGAYILSERFIQQRIQDRFLYNSEQLQKSIINHIYVYEQVLRSTVAFMYSSGNVSRTEFRDYIKKLELDQHWPGIQGIGYAIPVRPAELEKHIVGIQKEGFPDYHIKPVGERSVYTSIIYLEPFDWRNRRAFGYDMYSNDMRRRAMDRARETREPATSGLITLVQETDINVQKGFLTYVPLYGNRNEDAAGDKVAFYGWVYAAFRAGDLMKGVISREQFAIDFEIYDGKRAEPDSLLYDSNRQLNYSDAVLTDSLQRQSLITLQGRPWTLYFTPSEEFKAGIDGYELPQYIAVIGVVIDLLLFYVILSQHYIYRRAECLIDEKTKDAYDANMSLEAEKRLANNIIENLPLVLYVIEHDTQRVIRTNRLAQHLFNLNGTQSSPLFQRLLSRVNANFDASDDQLAANSIPQLDVETEEGLRWFNVRQVSFNDASGNSQLILGIANDTTDRIESERRFTALFDSAPCGLMLIRGEQTIQLVNQTLCETFGYSSSELCGQPVSMLVPDDVRKKLVAQVAEYRQNPIKRKMTQRLDLVGVAKDGTFVYLDIALQPLPYDDHRVLVSVVDISESYQLIKELERANQYKSEFLASMSHELRTPLNAIIGFNERVLKRASDVLGEREKDGLQLVQSSAHHLLSLINDILDLSKVEAGHMELKMEDLDLRQLLDLQLQMLAPWARKKGLTFQIELPPQPLYFTTDKSKMIRILNNLISNAVKYTEKGSITVTLLQRRDEQLGDVISIEVQDTGMGISEVDQGKLFNEFVRVSEAREKNIEGTGLGLVITARLVSMLEGRIELQSEHGKGSSFCVLLPEICIPKKATE